MSCIVNHKLFLGDMTNANDVEFIARNNITTIINIAADLVITNNDRNVVIYNFPIQDDYESDISLMFDEICEIIDRDDVVLVNCVAGISRSATVVIAYMMRQNSLRLKDAFLEVYTKRPLICPNKRFMQYLLEDEKKQFGENSLTQEECIQL